MLMLQVVFVSSVIIILQFVCQAFAKAKISLPFISIL